MSQLNIAMASIEPISITGSLNNIEPCPSTEEPIIIPAIKIDRDNNTIEKEILFIVRSRWRAIFFSCFSSNITGRCFSPKPLEN